VLQKATFVIPETFVRLGIIGLTYGLLEGHELAATQVCVSGFHTGVAPEHAGTQSLALEVLPVPVYILPGAQDPISTQFVPVSSKYLPAGHVHVHPVNKVPSAVPPPVQVGQHSEPLFTGV
jgi:hypothetical protein